MNMTGSRSLGLEVVGHDDQEPALVLRVADHAREHVEHVLRVAREQRRAHPGVRGDLRRERGPGRRLVAAARLDRRPRRIPRIGGVPRVPRLRAAGRGPRLLRGPRLAHPAARRILHARAASPRIGPTRARRRARAAVALTLRTRALIAARGDTNEGQKNCGDGTATRHRPPHATSTDRRAREFDEHTQVWPPSPGTAIHGKWRPSIAARPWSGYGQDLRLAPPHGRARPPAASRRDTLLRFAVRGDQGAQERDRAIPTL
jgi:hypothetical protein